MSKLEIKPIGNKEIWENLVKKIDEANFLQSWNWGEFQKALGKRIYRLGFFNLNKIVGCALCIKEEAKRGTYLTIAGGPLIDWNNPDYFSELITGIKVLANKENCSFIRARPQALDEEKVRNLFSKNGFRKAPMHLTADLTVELDLQKSGDQLLSEMRKNTRYEIKKAQKLGITVNKSDNPKEIKEFYNHQIRLAKKHNFVPFPYEFLHEQFKVFVADEQVLLLHSYLENRLLASAFVIFYGKEAVYHYGVSTEDNAKQPGSYACQWEAIMEAKRRGMKRYNLWGVAPREQTGHRFYGVSVFKRGFGGEEVRYLPTQDLILNSKYYINYVLEMGRKKIRKL